MSSTGLEALGNQVGGHRLHTPELSNLATLEPEAVDVMREVSAEFEAYL